MWWKSGRIGSYLLMEAVAVILRDDMLEVFVGDGCSRKNPGVWGGLGK